MWVLCDIFSDVDSQPEMRCRLSKNLKNCLVVGGGTIGQEYVAILSHLGANVTLITRSILADAKLGSANYIVGEIFDFTARDLETFTHCIIAVQPRFTFSVLRHLLKNTEAHILVEKPVCLFSKEFECLDVDQFNERVCVAFNRRRFESTELALSIISGKPILSMEVCFTEIKDRMRGSDDEIRLWGMCNTIHLFDMAFYLAGIPENVKTVRSTVSDVDSYSVTGTLANGVVSMNAHWGGPGNWGITVATPDEKLFFDPLEKLRVQRSGSFKKDEIIIDPEINRGFKDGFYAQTVDFLNGSKDKFISYANYKRLISVIEKIFN